MSIKELLQNKNTKIAVAILLVLGLGYGIGRYAQPAKVITKTEVKTEIKEKIQYIEKKDEKRNVVVISDKVTKPDGTVIEHTETKDNTQINTNTDINIAKDTKIETKTEVTQIRDSGLSVHALVLSKFDNLNDREYGVLIKKRIVGNVSGALQATNKGTIGISVGLDF